ncbi:PREDICTED: uncharacterized protein LOC107339672 [Acropora digitifera]|uniref:uncharacterized protein LOC107339672 n=1 Tax=Acropora digitifera TaxID=70779 RepID=UPI00077A5AEF|nr:PREDICTED: uncharacterized protein LOC107339672 [Acropora digitifera]
MANMISDDHVVLLEQTLHKNQQMIAENQKLREEMKAKEEEHSKVLREVLTELKNIRQKEDNVANRVRPQLQRNEEGTKSRFLQPVGAPYEKCLRHWQPKMIFLGFISQKGWTQLITAMF